MEVKSVLCFFLIYLCLSLVNLQGTGSGFNGNLRLCIVEGRGTYKRAAKYCPILDAESSGVECVIGTDRLDCLRRISKKTVDFGVFAPEDLVAALWADIDVLVTNQQKNRDRPFERSIVSVINRRIMPDGRASLHSILRNTTLCHPGVGLDDLRPLSDTISGYLESLLTERLCDEELSLTENRIKGMSQFFGRACKPGLWVPDRARDAELKSRYPSLCAACASPSKCSTGDRYWGDSGALECLFEGVGDVTWADLDDVTAYFSLHTNSPKPSIDQLSYLCRDGTMQPLRDNPTPCVWLNRPWPIVVAKRKASEAVSNLVDSLSNSTVAVDGHWHQALAALLETQALSQSLSPPLSPLDYINSARGFGEAYSQTGCDPPRHVTICTTSLLAKNKCDWMSEAGSVYGITPPIQCSYRDSIQSCMAAVQKGESDVTVADSDLLLAAVRDHNLTPILYEATPIYQQTSTVAAYVKKSAMLSKMADLRGKKAAFPRFDGFAWHSVLNYLSKMEHSSCNGIVSDFFGEICAPGANKSNVPVGIKSLTSNCYENNVEGEVQALRSLVEGRSDVAFISMNTFNKYQSNQIPDSWARTKVEIEPICPDDNKQYCIISWANIGHMLANKNVTTRRRHEITNVFTKLDQLFGKHPPFHSPMFTMYGAFNHELDVLFHNNTRVLATEDMLRTHPYDKILFNFERSIKNITEGSCPLRDFAVKTSYSSFTVLILCLVLAFLSR